MKSIFIAALVVALPVTAGAATLRVPQDHATIQAAVDAASDGDTIVVQRGVYFENVISNGKHRLRFVGKKAIWDGAPDGSKDQCLNATGDGITVQGFRLRNGSVRIVGDDATVTRCVIRSADETAVEISGRSATVTKNTLRGCYEGVEISGDDATVAKNTVTNMDDSGIDVRGDRAEVARNQVRVIEDGEGIYVRGDDAEIVRNKILNTDGSCIEVSGDDAVVERNRCTASEDSALLYVYGDRFRVVANRVSLAVDDSDGMELTAPTGGGLVERNLISDVVEDALELSGNDVTFRNNRILYSGSEDDEGFAISGHRNVLVGCQAIGCEGDAFDVSGDGNTLERCKAVDALEDGFDISGVGNTLVSCTARNCDAEGLDNEGTGTIVRGGAFVGCGIDIACDEDAGASFATFAPRSFRTGGEHTQPRID